MPGRTDEVAVVAIVGDRDGAVHVLLDRRAPARGRGDIRRVLRLVHLDAAELLDRVFVVAMEFELGVPARIAGQPEPVAEHAAFDQQRSEEHTSELPSLMRISYAVFCLKKKTRQQTN